MTEIPDLWATVDFPVLRDVARRLEVDYVNEVDPEVVAAQLDLTIDDVQRSLARLFDDDFVDGDDTGTLDGPSVLVRRLTAKGRREVGMWPNTLDLGRGFLELIEKAEQDEPDPKKKGWWRQLGRTVQNIGEGGVGSLIANLIAKGGI